MSTPAWAALPLDPGTAKVLSGGCRIVVDDGTISGALESIGHPVMEWRPIR